MFVLSIIGQVYFDFVNNIYKLLRLLLIFFYKAVPASKTDRKTEKNKSTQITL